jgi:hypothetical protein
LVGGGNGEGDGEIIDGTEDGVKDGRAGVVTGRAGAHPVRLALSTVETSRMINRVENIFFMVSLRRDTARSRHQRSDLWKNGVGGSPYSYESNPFLKTPDIHLDVRDLHF